jgi:hypothetical protein
VTGCLRTCEQMHCNTMIPTSSCACTPHASAERQEEAVVAVALFLRMSKGCVLVIARFEQAARRGSSTTHCSCALSCSGLPPHLPPLLPARVPPHSPMLRSVTAHRVARPVVPEHQPQKVADLLYARWAIDAGPARRRVSTGALTAAERQRVRVQPCGQRHAAALLALLRRRR